MTPASVLLLGDGVVSLTGFALTLFGPAAPAPTSTAGFAAPEALTDYRAAGPAADVYALGATLYALLTGHSPIERRRDENGLQFLLRAVSEAIRPLPESVPWPIAEVVHACLSKHPGLRPGSALEVRRALQQAAEVCGIAVPLRIDPNPLPPTPPEGTTRLEVLEGPPPAAVAPPPPRVAPIPEVAEPPPSRREKVAAGAGVLLLAAGALSALVVSGVIQPPGGDKAESRIAPTAGPARRADERDAVTAHAGHQVRSAATRWTSTAGACSRAGWCPRTSSPSTSRRTAARGPTRSARSARAPATSSARTTARRTTSAARRRRTGPTPAPTTASGAGCRSCSSATRRRRASTPASRTALRPCE